MLSGTAALIVVAAATLVTPVLFLASLAAAGVRRSRDQPVGPRLIVVVTILGGLSVGLMLVLAGDLIVALPLVGAAGFVAVALLRRGRPQEAGWLLAGVGAPRTVLWVLGLVASGLPAGELAAADAWLGMLAGAVPFLVGAALLVASRPAASRQLPSTAVPAGAGRRFGDLGRAILAPSRVGAFGLPEIGLLTALVVTWAGGSLVIPRPIPEPIRLAILVALGAVVGAEAWIRSVPAPARRAFEAFSWLGEWEHARVRAETGAGVPTSALAARRWLDARAERPDERWLRVEVLLLAGEIEEARAVAARMPDGSPQQRLDRALALDLADWFAGGDGDLEAAELAAAELPEGDEDARLRAAVAIAAARVRRRLASGEDAITAGAPLRDVRERLGRRADGQLGRAMRRRLQWALLAVGAVIAGLSLLLGALAPTG
jgi:hypothetical protein